jgi:DNA polymerase-3 subunit delta'
MTWQGIEGHDAIVARFRLALARGRLASTFLFVGPAGIGKRAFTLKLTQTLLCQNAPPELLEPCGVCPGCLQVLAGTHPDLHLVTKPSDKGQIPISAFIGEDGRRMREGLCHDIALKPFMGGRRVAIIDDADYLNEEGANSLLKTLEEPPPRSVLILIATSLERQLPTIRSRAQVVRFARLDDEVIARLLLAEGDVSDPRDAARLASFAEGSLERARELHDPELWSFRGELLGALCERPLASVRLAERLEAFVNEAGKEASARRARCRLSMSFAVALFRETIRSSVGLSTANDAELVAAAHRAVGVWGGQTDLAIALVDRTIEALNQVDRNANQSTLIAAWLDDLAEMIDRGRPLSLGRRQSLSV